MSTFYEFPALTDDGLEIWKKKRNEIVSLKEDAYGNNNSTVIFYPLNISKNELDEKLYKIFSGKDIEKIAKEHKELRYKIDHELVKATINIASFYLPPDTPLKYYLQVGARKMSEIDSKKDPRRGFKDSHTPIKTLPIKEWFEAIDQYVFYDERAYTEEINQYLPRDTDCPVSTVHKFFKADKKSNSNSNNRVLDYEILKPDFEIDCRTKSGSQLGYKIVEYFCGERKTVYDLAGLRIIHKEDYENRSFDLVLNFMSKQKGEFPGMLILQSLSKNLYKSKEDFLNNISKFKNLCDKIISVEDRSNLLSIEDLLKLKKKHYLEIVIPFYSISNAFDDSFGKNVIDALSYELGTFKKILEKKDHILYEGRKEDGRDTWTYLHWKLLEIVNELFITGFSNYYIKQILVKRLGKNTRIFDF